MQKNGCDARIYQAKRRAVREVAGNGDALKIWSFLATIPRLQDVTLAIAPACKRARHRGKTRSMSEKRFILNSSRSSKQGTLINVGKDSDEYKELTETMVMEADDMESIGLTDGQRALVKTEFGESEFVCQAGKVPQGMIFIAYGPPTCLLMGGDTGGTGMPTSKGWEVEVVPL